MGLLDPPALTRAAADTAYGLAPTATKTTAYTVAPGELALMNVPAGGAALALPAAPADKARVGVRAIGATTAAPLVLTAGGSDTIGDTGATTVSQPLAGEVTVLQYQAAATRWLAVANVKSMTSLDARYPVIPASGKLAASQVDTAAIAVSSDLAGAYEQRGTSPARDTAAVAGRYDAFRNAFNFKASNTRRLRAGLARAKAGTGQLKLATIGDSTVGGYPGVASTQSWPVLLREALAAAGFPSGGTGPVPGNPGGGGASYPDTRYTFTGTWTSQSNNPNFLLQTTVNGATATFKSDKPGTVAEIRYLNNGGTFTYSIDGAAAVTVTPTGAATAASVVVTGLARGLHTVVITSTSATNFFLAWVDVRDANNGVVVGNFGVNSSTTAHWTNTTFYFPGPMVAGWAPDVTFIELGINDLGGSTSTATYQANLQALITQFKALGDVILMIGNPTQSGDRSAYNAACYSLAASNDIPLIDLFDRLGSWASMNTLGLTADASHPNAAGYAEKAAGVVAAIAAPGVPGPAPRGELAVAISTADYATTSASISVATGLSATVVTSGRPVNVTFQGQIGISAAGYCQVFLFMDGAQIANLNEYFPSDMIGPNFARHGMKRMTPPPGSHTFDVRLATTAGTSTIFSGALLQVVEV